jgi:hypothetical protein
LEKTYDGMDCKYVGSEIINEDRVRFGIPQKHRAYRFEYEVENYSGIFDGVEVGDRFFIEAYSFEVVDDGLYSEYLADTEIINYSGDSLVDHINKANMVVDDLTVESAYYDMCVYKGEFDGEKETRFLSLVESGKLADAGCVIHVLGRQLRLKSIKKFLQSWLPGLKIMRIIDPAFCKLYIIMRKTT